MELLVLLVLWASWGCLADASSREPWNHDSLCSWPVTPRIVQAARTVDLQAAPLGPHSFPARLQLAFEVEGEGLLLDLAQNRELMTGSSGLTYYLPNGTRTVHPASPEGNCCYRGSVQGYPDSWASVCVCSGLSGLLTVSRFKSYTLESTPDGKTRAYGLKPASGICTQSQRFHPHLESKQAPLQRVKREAEAERGYVELVIVADHAEFKLDPNLNRTRTRILEIASHMDGFYRLLGLRVALVGAEVWNNGNQVSTNGSAKEILRRFLAWREKDLLPQVPHDNVQLIVGPPFPAGVIGASTQGSICSKGSGGISMGHSVSSLIMASTLSHQLGHNLGLAHDSDGCGCNTSIRPQSRKCIMEAPTGIMPGLSFSTCSQRRFQEILQSNQVGCLLDQPEATRLAKSRCGNRLVESGEQCDCGLFLECTDPCCNATTCQLIPGAQCATGQSCCHQCKLRSAGHTCRPVQNECDLPEFCDGTSPRCPSNVYKQDGSLCEGGKAVCHGGICPTYLSQCQARWGPDAIPTSESCVTSLNQRGDARGNCGQNPDGSYISCAKSDVRCGQLQCEKKRNGTVKTSNCLRDALKFVVAADVVDEAWALLGTNCGPNKVCINQRCQEVSSLKLPVCQCNGRGLCNSKGHCHCEPGWAPPHCQTGGLGGSVDSGPPAPGEANRATSTALVVIALLLAALLVVGLCCARRLGLHKRLCQFGKGTSCQYRTEPESQVQFLHPAERITQPEPRSYSKAPPNRPRPPQWKSSTELQLMPTSKPAALGAARPEPPSKPLPPDPVPKDPQDSAGERPGPPIRPLPPDPIPKIQSPGPTKPPPPQKPLPLDPPHAMPSCDPEIQMLPSRPAPPPPPTLAGSSRHPHKI
ncbi:disintegrin and metalloproteinase domain-containing protein 15 isoform X2 [Pantherophis guttatus]|uniref:Disintegrin and metalloproteinase domain-containing protein 15 isoform X2 n=1 Tax=Pantherophis guttatus TaxID=94885 RepID=A0ABM3YYA3_PANGU|nr:disintegrin and metalloproteinase domain-containing protein 15 isoform X2 [Pantherophis guttatus]